MRLPERRKAKLDKLACNPVLWNGDECPAKRSPYRFGNDLGYDKNLYNVS